MEVTEIAKLVELEGVHWWYLERRALLRQMVSSVLAPPAGHIAVDIGAAGGGNTLELQKLGMFSVPVEYGEVGARVAYDRGLPSVRGDARRLPLADRSVDVVLAFDVLEHIDDDSAALAEMWRVLRPSGSLLLAVPADMRLWSDHDLSVGHVRRYSRAGLVSAVEAAGFTLDDIRSWNVLLRPIVAMRRGRSKGSDLRQLNRVLNGTLRLIVSLERRLPWLHRRSGVSLLLSAHRAH
jgi:SAM-dependent methyltransferase